MSSLRDAVMSEMIPDLLEESGRVCNYDYNNGTITTPTLYQSPQRPIAVEVNGSIVEVILIDFLGLASDFPQTPQRGHKITDEGETFEVRIESGSKVYYETLGMIRIHTQKVHS